MKRSSIKFYSLATCSALLSAIVVSSAEAQNVPSSARPDVIDRQLRINEGRPDVGGAPIVVSPQAQPSAIEGDLDFKLESITFEGLGAFSESDLQTIYQDRIGETITLNELNGIVNQITAFYRNNGYILSRAVLPPQRIETGDVKIRIVEGFVDQVILEGEVGSDSSPIHKYARKIKESKPLNAAKLERYLLLMQDLPGVEARAVLTPSPDTPGASNVVINVTRKTFEASATIDNRGSRFLGPIQAGVTGTVNNVLGLDEQTQIRVINSILEDDELRFGEIRHEQQIGGEGLELILSASYVATEPGSPTLEALGVEADSVTFSAGLSYPILRSRQSNWFVNTSFTSRETDIDADAGDISEDKLRVVTLGTTYDFLDKYSAINRFEAEIAQGLNIGTGVDNGVPRSRNNGETNFTKFSGSVSRLQPISGPWSASFAAIGQYSVDPLLASQEFVIGGEQFGSAFDSAEITGDSGVATRLELQYNNALPEVYISQYQLYGFYDIGRVWNRNVIAGSEPQNASLASTGIGARFNINESISGSLEGAIPLTRDVAAFGADGSAPRGFFRLQYRY